MVSALAYCSEDQSYTKVGIHLFMSAVFRAKRFFDSSLSCCSSGLFALNGCECLPNLDGLWCDLATGVVAAVATDGIEIVVFF